MGVVDLNADLGESDVPVAGDMALLDVVTSASVACGAHAGSGVTMRAVVEAAGARQVTVGAHVSYPDREGFGRRETGRSAQQVGQDVVDQIGSLQEVARSCGGRVAYVKAHGALYHRTLGDRECAAALAGAARSAGVAVLLGPAGSAACAAAESLGMRGVAEAFCDRAYEPDGTLTSRDATGALLADADRAAAQAVSLVVRGGVEARDGTWVVVPARSLCVHGDNPAALATAGRVRAALEEAGVVVRAFTR